MSAVSDTLAVKLIEFTSLFAGAVDALDTSNPQRQRDETFNKLLFSGIGLGFYAGAAFIESGPQLPVGAADDMLQSFARAGLALDVASSIVDIGLRSRDYHYSKTDENLTRLRESIGKLLFQGALATLPYLAAYPPATALFYASLVFTLSGWIFDLYVKGELPLGLEKAFAYIANNLTIIRDPLILDLDGDGITTSSLTGSTTYFDYDGDGFAERTGWASPGDGILVFDRNGNGVGGRSVPVAPASTHDFP